MSMSLWVMASSPLLTCNDVRSMNDDIKQILTNEEVLSVHKDPAARMAVLPSGVSSMARCFLVGENEAASVSTISPISDTTPPLVLQTLKNKGGVFPGGIS